MKVGVIARATDRGLGIQTWEAARNLDASVLVVDLDNPSSRRYPTNHCRFPGAPIVPCETWQLPEAPVRDWLATVDVVYSAETFYDGRLPAWAHDTGTATVLHLNPEFVARDYHARGPKPSAWWSATSWRLHHLPTGTQVVPFPVALDRWPAPAPAHGGPCRWLHVAGKRALGDRNGTKALTAALPLLTEPCQVTIAYQDEQPPKLPEVPDHVQVELAGPVANYWDLYTGHDALVMPRRYGGLCLPVQEAMAAGLAVVMTACPPNTDWPITPVPVLGGRRERMPAGKIEAFTLNPRHLAQAMDSHADPATRAAGQTRARRWAAEHSWDALLPDWLERFAALKETTT